MIFNLLTTSVLQTRWLTLVDLSSLSDIDAEKMDTTDLTPDSLPCQLPSLSSQGNCKAPEKHQLTPPRTRRVLLPTPVDPALPVRRVSVAVASTTPRSPRGVYTEPDDLRGVIAEGDIQTVALFRHPVTDEELEAARRARRSRSPVPWGKSDFQTRNRFGASSLPDVTFSIPVTDPTDPLGLKTITNERKTFTAPTPIEELHRQVKTARVSTEQKSEKFHGVVSSALQSASTAAATISEVQGCASLMLPRSVRPVTDNPRQVKPAVTLMAPAAHARPDAFTAPRGQVVRAPVAAHDKNDARTRAGKYRHTFEDRQREIIAQLQQENASLNERLVALEAESRAIREQNKILNVDTASKEIMISVLVNQISQLERETVAVKQEPEREPATKEDENEDQI